MTEHDIDIQIESKASDIPDPEVFIQWANAALACSKASVCIRIVDEAESAALNTTYREKEGPTNVLSFPVTDFDTHDVLHGDIVICAPLVKKEATEQHKAIQDHWAHLTVHGLLHLQGYDHISDEDASIMEAQETRILSTFDIANPYD